MDRLETLLEPVVATLGFELVLLEWSGTGRGRRLRLFIDHPDGVTVEDCAEVSHAVSNALEAAESGPEAGVFSALLGQPYTLEVSSPGLDRPLVRRRHFDQFRGQRVKIKTVRPIEQDAKQKTFHGTIEGTEPDAGQPDDDKSGTVQLRSLEGDRLFSIPIPAIRRANLVYEG